MAFDLEWNRVFESHAWGKYPSEDLVRFMMRKFGGISKSERQAIRVLDLGCGGGANSWFLAREGFQLVAVDGSAKAVERTRRFLETEGLKAEYQTGDFVNLG